MSNEQEHCSHSFIIRALMLKLTSLTHLTATTITFCGFFFLSFTFKRQDCRIFKTMFLFEILHIDSLTVANSQSWDWYLCMHFEKWKFLFPTSRSMVLQQSNEWMNWISLQGDATCIFAQIMKILVSVVSWPQFC